MPVKISDKVLSWASILDENTIEQVIRTSKMPFIEDYIALQADAHVGKGSTVGSVIPTRGAIIPSALGVDLGCGMMAVETTLTSADLPDDLSWFHSGLQRAIPSGVGQGNNKGARATLPTSLVESGDFLDLKEKDRARKQFGTLGSGNHFVEVCLDDHDNVWLMLHSGSRGIGHILASKHIEKAKGLMKKYFIELEDPDLAYLVEGTPEFDEYIQAMLWAQDYARLNREEMMKHALEEFAKFLRIENVPVALGVSCHHNFCQKENIHGKNMWITRKGAISAREGQLGIIPGSMATGSYIVRGLGSEASLQSCSHGAGRVMSRSRARKELTADSLREYMKDKTWNSNDANALVDEHPLSYKDLSVVMEDQKDLVEVVARLNTILNLKGT